VDAVYGDRITAGLITSNVDFGTATNREFDLYLLYSLDAGSDLTLDLAAWRYTYRHEYNANYNEYMLGLHYRQGVANVWYADDYAGAGGNQFYYDAGITLPVTNEYSLQLHAGHTDCDAQVGVEDYSDYSLAILTKYVGFAFSLQASTTTGDHPGDSYDDKALIRVSRSFALF